MKLASFPLQINNERERCTQASTRDFGILFLLQTNSLCPSYGVPISNNGEIILLSFTIIFIDIDSITSMTPKIIYN